MIDKEDKDQLYVFKVDGKLVHTEVYGVLPFGVKCNKCKDTGQVPHHRIGMKACDCENGTDEIKI